MEYFLSNRDVLRKMAFTIINIVLYNQNVLMSKNKNVLHSSQRLRCASSPFGDAVNGGSRSR